MKFINRMLVWGILAGVAPLGVSLPTAVAQEQSSATQVSEEQLGQMIGALGLQPKKKEKRFDFAFAAKVDGQQWELSMSAVLSHDEKSIWIMAWLDELPKASNEVPRTALLRLLAQNDQMGSGKFFAYIPANRRFVLQRTVENENLTSARLRILLQDLGTSVVENYPIWSTANWNGIPAAPVGKPSQTPASGASSQSASNESKFEQPLRR